MGFLSFLKSTNPKQTKELNDTIAKLEKKPKASEYKPTYEFMPKPAEMPHYIPKVKITDFDGNLVEVPYDELAVDQCLIKDDSDFYHTYTGCFFVQKGGYRLSTIPEAKKAGKCMCESCWDAINRIREDIEIEESYDGDDD